MTKPERTPWTRDPLPWPQRGVPGGWRDVWEQDDEVTVGMAHAPRVADETEPVRAAWRTHVKPTIPRSLRVAPEPRAETDAAASPAPPDHPALVAAS